MPYEDDKGIFEKEKQAPYHISSVTFLGGANTGGFRWAFNQTVKYLHSISFVTFDIPFEMKQRPLYPGDFGDPYGDSEGEDEDSLYYTEHKENVRKTADDRYYLLPSQHEIILRYLSCIHMHPMVNERGKIGYLRCPLSSSTTSADWRSENELWKPTEEDAKLCESCKKPWQAGLSWPQFRD